jgi:AraC family carnitine catabolism transcriptional activator
MWVDVDHDLASIPQVDYLLLFEGNLPTQRNSPRLLAAIRTARRYGSTVIAVDTGAFAFTQAGLGAETEAVLHWEAVPAYRERFPGHRLKNQLFLLTPGIGYTAGGVATLDLMLELIGRLAGQALADEVANALVHARRSAELPQRSDDPDQSNRPSLARRAVAIMEQNLDFPLTPSGLASHLGISVRSLERYCARHFSQSPMQLYLRIRLQAARNFLFYEELSAKDIANACGFSYPSVFTRAFKAQFGETPRQFRASFRARQAAVVRPEIQRLSGAKGRRQ